ncbi:hypothetical protein CDV36_011769 [Fusarium kuroshium]|uniref:Uncharacterized protein n=1 Tax=Fusarium kuroshium TaxID=2010991 RepID=A0A3M2RTI5_9HYPO|nr:hypothetical protein CDV36_011769 [Fusarium kuroshium]
MPLWAIEMFDRPPRMPGTEDQQRKQNVGLMSNESTIGLVLELPTGGKPLSRPPTNQQASPLSNSLLLLVLVTASQLNKRLVPQPQPLGYPEEEFTELRS